MRSADSLVFRIWAAISAVSLVSVFGIGVTVREAFRRAFLFYLEHQGMIGGPRSGGVGAMMLGATELEFQKSVDEAIVIAAVSALLLSLVAAYVVARALTGPLARLTVAAQGITQGDLSHRVEVEGTQEVARLGVAFNDMAESLEEGESLRRRMVADVAHELRNPVAALRAQAEGMSEGVLAADKARMDSLVEDTAHLSRLVDDLHELSVAEAGRIGYERVRLDIGSLVTSEVARAGVQASGGVEVHTTCSRGGPVVLADEHRIAQVLRNLLSNALRHTDSGRIEVLCEVGPETATVSVSDTGEGIPAADLPHIFERFYRADAARARETGGSGVGLAIAKRIVEDHGGAVFASSPKGGGTSVGFTLPLAGEG